MTPAECRQALKQRWPALFAGPAKPIKLRIQKDIQERDPGAFTRSVLSGFLHRHTGSTSYLLAVARGGPRFDLDGKPDGEVSEEHRKVASDELARRRANQTARIELEQQQRRNRAGLLRDFERTTLTRTNFCALKGVAESELDGLLALARDEAAQAPLPARERPSAARREPRTHEARARRQRP
jgi:sRNA-binding protein